nr:hypothetical protein [Lactiplantibacillus plantarum]
MPLRAAQWYQFKQSRTKLICSVPITTTQYAAVTHLAAQRLKAGQAGMLPAPEQPVMTGDDDYIHNVKRRDDSYLL